MKRHNLALGVLLIALVECAMVMAQNPLDKPYDKPQYLIHFTETSTTSGPRKRNDYALWPEAPKNGILITADGEGGTFTNKAELLAGPFRTPRDACNGANGRAPQSFFDSLGCPRPKIIQGSTLTGITRQVEIQHAGSGWMPATPGMKVGPGDKVHTGFKSSVTIALPDGHVVQMQQLSMIAIEGNGVFVYLGEVSAQVGRKGRGASDFEVHTAAYAISVRGTIFSVNVNEAGLTTVSVQEGEVYITPTNSSLRPVTLRAGQQVRLSSNQIGPVTAIANTGGGVGCGVGTTWNEVEAGTWTSVWTRRGNSSVFDANYLNGRARTVNTVTITGNHISIKRTQSSDNNFCTYDGSIAADGVTVTGKYACNRGGGDWSATIHCAQTFIR